MKEVASPCRWGILGAASIARKNVRAMHLADNARPVAIASRNPVKAAAFAEEHGVDRTHRDYESLLRDPDVDAVYIPLPTTLHREWTVRAAEAGKHVLCEKPVAANATDAEAMIEACRDAGVQFMDGLMFMHHERMRRVESMLPRLGAEPNLLTSGFSFRGDADFFENNIRGDVEAEPLGCVGDLGWYCIRMAIEVMGGIPEAVRARHHRMHGAIPIHTTAELDFPGPDGVRHAMIQCSFLHPLRQWVEICGPDGAMWMEDFVIGSPTEAVLRLETESNLTDRDLVHERRIERIVVEDCVQEVEMIRRFSDIARNDRPLEPRWATRSHETQRVVDAIMASASVGGARIPIDP
ncbi:MAG: hypothetical protein CMJ52_05315 [Planctomycetaceae bacterium]|nr:hypothetical protein [Planctomycetaceae bacterium]